MADGRHLLLLGGGHAHLSVLERLATQRLSDWAVTLVTPDTRQIYSGMLPGWVAGNYTLDDFAIPLDALAERAGIGFAQTVATGLDLDRRELSCADGRRLPFDLLSIDTGPQPALDAVPGAAEHALPVRPLQGFIAACPAIFERWRASAARFEVVIVGGGAAAVELGFALQQRASLARATGVRITLAAADAEPLAGGASCVRHRVAAYLRAAGIDWQGSSRATRIGPGEVVREHGAPLAFDACIVATGAAAPGWPRAAGLATDGDGFIRVDRALRSVSHPQVFAAGDVAAYAEPRPKSGVFAVRAGPVLADNLLAACRGEPLRDWQPQRRALSLVSTADGRAIATWGPWCASGPWVWRWKDRIDRRFVQRFKRPVSSSTTRLTEFDHE